tara:strand:+ start:2520 stop:2954 length:435 start_codon:yes stop_codon:yes gene_type:complete
MKYIIGYSEDTGNINWTAEFPNSKPDTELDTEVSDFLDRGFNCFWVEQEEPVIASIDFYADGESVSPRTSLLENPPNTLVVNVEHVISDLPIGTTVHIDGVEQGVMDDTTLELTFETVGLYEIVLTKYPEYNPAIFSVEVVNEA